MRYTALLPLAAAAGAFMIPTKAMNGQLSLGQNDNDGTDDVGDSPWWEDLAMPGRENGMPSLEDLMGSAADTAWDAVDDAIETATGVLQSASSEFRALPFPEAREQRLEPRHSPEGGCRHGGHGDCDKTLYELIRECRYSKRFADLVDEHDDIADMLKSTKSNHTVFVPTDRAFERFVGHHHGDKDKDGKKPSREHVEHVLRYHIVPGRWPAGRLLPSPTLPTELALASLGQHRQRLRVSAGLLGVRLNLYSRVVAADVWASNGVAHAVDAVLLPPPRQGRLVEAFPGTASTFLLALERTRLGEELRAAPQRGGTVFVPSNRAFARLGPRLNAFLFSERGLKYLRGLLKYHVVVNETLYSDAYYGPGKHEDGDGDHGDGDGDVNESDSQGQSHHHHALPRKRWHVELPTLLDDTHVSVDGRRFLGVTRMVVNGWSHVSFQDGVSRDGVIHIVESVLIPPCRHKGDGHCKDHPEEYEDDEMSAEELKDRLSPYVSTEETEEEFMGDL